MSDELLVVAGGRLMGRLQRASGGRLAFRYDEFWRTGANAFPLSLSMPLGAATHPHAAVECFLWGLLPDNPWILDRWARRFQVSARNVFALVSRVGEDCAGAIQIVPPDRLEDWESPTSSAIEWLSEAEVAARLGALRSDASAWRQVGDVGQFSLAGAQPKIALIRIGDRWGIPSGKTPTTHVLKPPIDGLDGHEENEHFCLSLAKDLGLPAAESWVASFGEQRVVVVERFDRVWRGEVFERVHQEDLCQALSVRPERKYESDGGPGVESIATLLANASSSPREDVATFVDALAFNWLIGGTDAHAKNYSILLGAGSKTRLAPLYDLASILPYESPRSAKLKLAMKVGGESRLRFVAGRHWRTLAQTLRLDPHQVAARVADLADHIPDLAGDALAHARRDGLTGPSLPRLVDHLQTWAADCRGRLDR